MAMLKLIAPELAHFSALRSAILAVMPSRLRYALLRRAALHASPEPIALRALRLARVANEMAVEADVIGQVERAATHRTLARRYVEIAENEKNTLSGEN